MRVARRFLPVALLALFLGPLALPAAAAETTVLQRDEVLRHGLAKETLRGQRLLSGRAYLKANGEMAATLSYGLERGRPAFSFDVRWREAARRGTKPARDFTPGGLPDLYWHPLKQVQVTYKLVGNRSGLDLDGLHAAAKVVAERVAGRARPWQEPFASLGLKREMREGEGFRLTHAKHLDMRESFTTELDYRSPTRTVQVGGKAKHLSRGYEITVRWFEKGKRPSARDASYWRYRPMPKEGNLHEKILLVVYSPTHYIKVDLRGEHYGRDGFDDHFQDREHWETAMARLREVLAIFEARLAQPRETPAGSVADSPHVVERPKEQAQTSQGSGTIKSVGGRLMVMRGGKRVNLRSGGRVQLGDVLITGGGKVVVRFDDPEAGPGSNGTLEIAPRSKVVIDVGPYRPETRTRPTRIRLEEGAVRFARPHKSSNPRVELGTPGDVAIFGLVGTDALLVRLPMGYVLTLRDGMGDIRLNGKHAKVMVPIRSYWIDFDGTLRGERSVDESVFRESVDVVGLGP